MILFSSCLELKIHNLNKEQRYNQIWKKLSHLALLLLSECQINFKPLSKNLNYNFMYESGHQLSKFKKEKALPATGSLCISRIG